MLCFLIGAIPLINAQKYNFQTYDIENDLDISSISAMTNSENGYLYIADGETVYLFNGKRTEPVIRDYTLPFSEIKSLREDGNRNLLLLSNNQLKIFGEDEPIIAESVFTYELRGNKVYFGNEKGVKVFDKLHNTILRPDGLLKLENIEINDLEIVDNFLYITSRKGLYRYNINKDHLDDYSLTSTYDLRSIRIDQSGNLWTFDHSGTLLKIDLKSKNVSPYGNQGFDIINIAIDSSDRIWVGTSNKGILLYDQSDDLWKTIDQKNGLPDNRVVEIIVDAWGVVWIATADRTLSKFIDRDYELYNVYDGMASDEVSGIYAADEGLYFSAGNKGVFKFQDGKFSEIYQLDIKCEAIYKDSTDLWIGTNGNGLLRINASESTVFRKNAGIPSDWISQIVKSTDGSIWVGTPSNGLAHLSQRDSTSMSVMKYGLEEGLADQYITALYASTSGPIYFGTRSGRIGMLNFGEFIDLSTDSLSSEITNIVEGRYGEIFFSSISDGVFGWANEKKGGLSRIRNYPNNVKAISFRDNKLWAVNDKGITDGNFHFTAVEGFPSNKIAKGGMVSFQNRNWIASMDGLIGIGKLNDENKLRQPRIHFSDIQANYKSITFDKTGNQSVTRIKYKEQPLSFEYEGVDIHSNKDLTYSYILEGQDKMWSPWTKNDNPIFNNLTAGAYTFSVKAKSDDESISDALSFDIIIDGPIWKEWWFLPSAALGIALLGFLLFRNRLRAVRKKNEEEKAKLELKNRLLELEQKANQLQMNPHFIFNALNSIQATVAKEDYKDARKEISDFATLMRSILANSKESVIALEDELKLLRKYIDIERKCRTLGFEYTITVAEEIDSEEAQIPPMLIQPFVENAIIHGLSKKKSGKLSLTFSLLEENVMLVSVEDDGIGYENSKVSSVRKKHKSVAIEVTKERLETLLDKSHFPVLDISQRSEEGGTVVQLKIPVVYEF